MIESVLTKKTQRLLALGLELPEETLVKLHNFEAEGDSYGKMFAFLSKVLISFSFACLARFMK